MECLAVGRAFGTTLDQFADISRWENAAENLAELQIASIGKTCALLDAGCRDLRLQGLVDLVSRFVARMAEFMAAQVKLSPPLSRLRTSISLGTLARGFVIPSRPRDSGDAGASRFEPRKYPCHPRRVAYFWTGPSLRGKSICHLRISPGTRPSQSLTRRDGNGPNGERLSPALDDSLIL